MSLDRAGRRLAIGFAIAMIVGPIVGLLMWLGVIE